MGLDRQTLPDQILKRIDPADRKAAGLPGPFALALAEQKAKEQFRREKDLQQQICNWLALRNVTVIRSNMSRPTTNNRGCPDLIFAIDGRATALEVKLPGRQPTDEQVAMLLKLAADGWKTAIVTSLDEVRVIVAEVGKWDQKAR